MPNPLKDIQEQGAKEFYEKSDIRVEKGGFTYLYENRDELNLETIIDFLNQQTTIAFQAGEKEGNKVTLDMVLKEIEGEISILKLKLEPLKKEYDEAYKYWVKGIKSESIEKTLKEYEDGTKGHKLFSLSEKIDALSSLKEKIISDNQK